MERKTLTVVETARILGIGRNAAYQAVQSGSIPSIRIGRRYLVPHSALEKLLEETTGTDNDKPTTNSKY